jgi:hypothetical protein
MALNLHTRRNGLTGSPLTGTSGGVQYNNAGVLAGDSNFITNGAGSVDITGDLDVDNININGDIISNISANGPIVLKPNSGSFSGGIIYADCPNSTAGNARGRRSVDLQLDRDAATKVVSGRQSAAIGGQNNTISGNFSFVGAGKSNTISTNYSAAFGQGNSISGNDYNLAVGLNNTVTGGRASAHGQSNTVAASMAHAFGASNNIDVAAGYGCAIGRGHTINTANYGFAQGKNNTVSGKGSSAIGMEHNVTANYAGAFAGYNFTVSAKYSAAIGGYNSTVSAQNSLVAGKSVNLSGKYSFACGISNTVSATYSIVGGKSNTASAPYSAVFGRNHTINLACAGAIIGGRGHTSDGPYAVLFGNGNTVTSAGNYALASGKSHSVSGRYGMAHGKAHTVSGKYAASVGHTNTASGYYSLAVGYRAVASLKGQLALAGGRFAADGDAQTSIVVVRRSTTTNTQSELFTDGTAARIAIPSDSTFAFSAIIVARRTDADNESAAYKIEGVIDNNAGTTALVGSIVVTVLAEDTVAWDATAEADNTNDALVFKVTGENAKTIRWVGTVNLTKVAG